MIPETVRKTLWNQYSGGRSITVDSLEKLSTSYGQRLIELENVIRSMIANGIIIPGDLSVQAIALEIRHEALWRLCQRRQCESGPLPQMARAF
uniref:Uncharacterized protein n=1 Tax=viral metagenome TaxID=1070528 RepID=A0A6M3M073_9ZZZZ